MVDLLNLTIAEASRLLAEKKVSAVELAEASLVQIEQHDEKLGAVLDYSGPHALEQAKKADATSPENRTALTGIPAGVKDAFVTTDFKTTAASKILEGYVAPYDATVVKKLRENKAVIVGKNNCDEFAIGSSNENSAYKPAHNPWDLERTPGGSSGGSAVSVAAGEVLYSLGSDTGGSIRLPASLVGVVGLKPTYGRISRFGLIAMTSSLDCPGVFAKTVEDVKFVFEAIAGHDKRDATTGTVPVPQLDPFLTDNLKGLKVGIPKEYFAEGLDADVAAAVHEGIKILEKQGAEVKEVSLPHTKYALPTYYPTVFAEVSSNLARFDGLRFGPGQVEADSLRAALAKTRGSRLGKEVKRRIMLGTYVLSEGYYDAYYGKAQKVRTLIKQDFDNVFKEVDLLVTPTSPSVAFKLGEKIDDPLQMYLSDIYCVSVNLAGVPAMSVPCGFSQGLPIGMQIIGPQWGEEKVFQAGFAYQSQTDWHTKHPTL